MARKVSIYDIARALGMSTSTVSRALNDNPAISEQTRALVREEAARQHYVPNTFAVNLKRGLTKTIGVVVPYIDRNFFSSAIEGIEEEAYRLGYDVLICHSKDLYEREKNILANLSQGKVDGVIASVAAGTRDLAHYNDLPSRGIRLVLFDRTADGTGDAQVTADDYTGACNMTKHLIAQGRRRIFHYGGLQHVAVWRNRYKGYCDALKESGIEPGEGWFTEGMIERENGTEYARELLSRAEKPDAVFCASDYVALGVLTEFARQSVRVPEEIAVAGYANENFGELIRPALSSVNQFSKEMGRTACYLLMQLLRGEKADNVTITPELIIRESTTKLGHCEE